MRRSSPLWLRSLVILLVFAMAALGFWFGVNALVDRLFLVAEAGPDVGFAWLVTGLTGLGAIAFSGGALWWLLQRQPRREDDD